MARMSVTWAWQVLVVTLVLLVTRGSAYVVSIKDTEGMRQACSGMYAGKNTSIDVIFEQGSQGRASALVYEVAELGHIGKHDPYRQTYGQLYKSYVCTPMAVEHKLCTQNQLGQFIIDESQGQTYTIEQQTFDFGANLNQSVALHYNVTVDGYYCVGATAVTVGMNTTESLSSTFQGRVDFHNIFDGNLPAAEHPKLLFYALMTLAYIVLGAAWISLSAMHRDQIVTVQHFISVMIVFLVIEMACEWLFYLYFNRHQVDYSRFVSVDKSAAVTTMARFLLVLTNFMGAARDSLSFFLLLIVSMGYGVVRPTIGSVLRKVQILTVLHFLFGCLYSVGIILILIDMEGTWTLFFIFPLAGTLSAFMSWTLYSLKSTMQYLTDRRQSYKCSMFQRLYLILMCAVVAIVGFFVFSSFILATNDTNDLATTSWQYRWFLLDGSMTILYFLGQNMRLAMSDELATDEEADGGHYEVHTLGGSDDELDEDAIEVQSEHLQDLSHMQEAVRKAEERPKLDDQSFSKLSQDEDSLVFDADTPEHHHEPPARPSYDANGNHVERERLRLSDDEDDHLH
ncbi:hypothetical protein MPSI1_000909 [Malassezia psittaci]|uniref:Membrane protein PTM1 n=1 Tax=Malassezia psittaci TaxID=1821823 RepID=A0AAF0JD34_9BASI|nr:hypothetical protein MPSI1_000909 [Malassezia psittaci]